MFSPIINHLALYFGACALLTGLYGGGGTLSLHACMDDDRFVMDTRQVVSEPGGRQVKSQL